MGHTFHGNQHAQRTQHTQQQPTMTSYTLHAPEASFRAFAALIAAEYNGVEIDIQTDLAAASKSPTGKLPLLEITKKNGTVTRIFSAQAIARYIASIRRDTGLMGNGISAEASINAWVDFSAQDLELPVCIWFYPVRKRYSVYAV
jgi:elongation factor 1-gamma